VSSRLGIDSYGCRAHRHHECDRVRRRCDHWGTRTADGEC